MTSCSHKHIEKEKWKQHMVLILLKGVIGYTRDNADQRCLDSAFSSGWVHAWCACIHNNWCSSVYTPHRQTLCFTFLPVALKIRHSLIFAKDIIDITDHKRQERLRLRSPYCSFSSESKFTPSDWYKLVGRKKVPDFVAQRYWVSKNNLRLLCQN